MMRTIDPELLRTFVAIAETRGFGAAAQRLNRGQSAVSLQIKRLEEQLRVRLLDRTSRRVTLTPAGEMLIGDARRILELNERLLERAREPELSGLVRVGAPEDFATTRLPGLLAEFRRTHPRIALEVVCELTLELAARFTKGELDIALLKREPAVALDGTPVLRERLVWCAGHGADDLLAEKELPLVCSPIPCVYRGRAVASLESVGRNWRIAYSCGSLAGNHAAVRAGLGVAVLPQNMVPGDLIVLEASAHGLPQLADTEIALVSRPSLTPAARTLSAYIARELESGSMPRSAAL